MVDMNRFYNRLEIHYGEKTSADRIERNKKEKGEFFFALAKLKKVCYNVHRNLV